MKFESLIFDIDGTLWDSRALVAEGYNRQLRREGLEQYCTDAEKLKPLFGMTLEDLAGHMFPDLPQDRREELIRRCMKTENEFLWSDPCDIGFPGVRETLEQLAKTYRLFIVSNSGCGYPELCITKLGLGELIEGHMCHGDTGLPKGETIRILMEKYHTGLACYIGDTEGDRAASAAAGIPFLFCGYGFGQPADWWQRIDSIRELPEVLEKNK